VVGPSKATLFFEARVQLIHGCGKKLMLLIHLVKNDDVLVDMTFIVPALTLLQHSHQIPNPDNCTIILPLRLSIESTMYSTWSTSEDSPSCTYQLGKRNTSAPAIVLASYNTSFCFSMHVHVFLKA